jgi:hypothetical protein
MARPSYRVISPDDVFLPSTIAQIRRNSSLSRVLFSEAAPSTHEFSFNGGG